MSTDNQTLIAKHASLLILERILNAQTNAEPLSIDGLEDAAALMVAQFEAQSENPSPLPRSEQLKQSIEQLNRVVKEQETILAEKREELRHIEAVEYIREHGMTPAQIHNTNDDPKFDYVHDNDKFARIVRETVTLPYFSYNGFVYDTNVVKAGEPKFNAGVPVQLKDFTEDVT